MIGRFWKDPIDNRTIEISLPTDAVVKSLGIVPSDEGFNAWLVARTLTGVKIMLTGGLPGHVYYVSAAVTLPDGRSVPYGELVEVYAW